MKVTEENSNVVKLERSSSAESTLTTRAVPPFGYLKKDKFWKKYFKTGDDQETCLCEREPWRKDYS